MSYIMQRGLCNLDLDIPHFYIGKLGFTGVCIIFLLDCVYLIESPQ